MNARHRHSPRDQDSVVMMSHPVFRNTVAIAVMRQDGLLPLAETIQRLVSMMVYLQVGLQSGDNPVSHFRKRAEDGRMVTRCLIKEIT